MRPLHIPDPFHRDDVFPVHAHEGSEARIDGGVVDLASGGVVLRYHDGTGSAATFGAAQFRAREAYAAQVFEEGDFGVGFVEYDFGAVEVEAQGVVVLLRDGGEGALRGWLDGGLGGDAAGCHVGVFVAGWRSEVWYGLN